MAIFGDDGKALTSDDLKSKSAPQDDEPGWFQPGSQSDALVRGLANGATLGTGKYIGGAVNGLVNGDPNKSTWQNIKDAVNGEVGANKSASDANPYTYGAGNLVGGLPIALASGGAGAAPEAGATGVMAAAQKVAALKSVPAQMAKNAATGAVTAAADNPDNPLGAAAGGAATGAGLSGAAGLAGKAISAVGNKVTSSMGSKRVMDTIKDLTDTSKKANMGGETQSTVDMLRLPTTVILGIFASIALGEDST